MMLRSEEQFKIETPSRGHHDLMGIMTSWARTAHYVQVLRAVITLAEKRACRRSLEGLGSLKSRFPPGPKQKYNLRNS